MPTTSNKFYLNRPSTLANRACIQTDIHTYIHSYFIIMMTRGCPRNSAVYSFWENIYFQNILEIFLIFFTKYANKYIIHPLVYRMWGFYDVKKSSSCPLKSLSYWTFEHLTKTTDRCQDNNFNCTCNFNNISIKFDPKIHYLRTN